MEECSEEKGSDKRGKSQEQKFTTTITSLPREILLGILSRLPISTLVNLKHVNKSWRNLAQDPLLISQQVSHSNDFDPCLILHSDFPMENRLHSLDLSSQQDENHTIAKHHRLPELPNFDVVGSCNGLLCLSDKIRRTSVVLYNPFTRELTELPEPTQPWNQQKVTMGFGFHLSTKQYKLVRIVYLKGEDDSSDYCLRNFLPPSQVQVFTVGRPTWKITGESPYQLIRRASSVSSNGRLHWLTCYHKLRQYRIIISFDLEDEQFREVPEPDCGNFGHRQAYLTTINGCLSTVVYWGHLQFDIWIMKNYGVKESWVREYTITSYVPPGLGQDVDQTFSSSIFYPDRHYARFLCVLKSGRVLIEYRHRCLVAYDPMYGTFEELRFRGLPDWFEAVVHIGSLVRIDGL